MAFPEEELWCKAFVSMFAPFLVPCLAPSAAPSTAPKMEPHTRGVILHYSAVESYEQCLFYAVPKRELSIIDLLHSYMRLTSSTFCKDG